MQSTQSHLICEMCGARVATLRRGRCWVCYIRWAESRPVGQGASCVVCNDRRRENLRMVEFHRTWLAMCHNCGTNAYRLSPLPRTIEGLRQRLSRDRRWQQRRDDAEETRARPKERRNLDRRVIGRGAMDEWEDAEQLIIEICEAAVDVGDCELTVIAKRPERDDACRVATPK